MKRLSFLLLACVPNADVVFSQGVFVKKLRVQRESDFDWQYVVKQSVYRLDTDDRLEDYNSRAQLYDFFGPRSAPSRALPLILFISPGNAPLEWKHFTASCQRHGIMFAGLRKAGNGQNPAVRIRAALDVLGDVHRRYRVDPDRTYVAGFSGGAIIATQLAFALPECFGGVLCIGQRVMLPRSDVSLDRSSERISVAALCGGNEVVGPEVEHLDQPICRVLGFRCRVFVSRGAGHRMPKPGVISAAYQWLERGTGKRKSLAETHAATRLATAGYDAASWQNALLAEADQRGQAGESAAVGLFGWIAARWPESPAGKLALERLQQHRRDPKFLEQQGIVEEERQAKINEALVLGYEKLAFDRRSWFTAERRADYATRAIQRIDLLGIELDGKLERIEALKKVAAKSPN